MSKDNKRHSFIGLFAVLAALLAVAAAIADTARTPDATASSSAAAINTTIGDSDLSPEGGLSTLPLSFVIIVR